MKFIKRLAVALLLMGLLGIGAVGGIYLYVAPELPSVEVLKDVQLQTPMRVYSADGKLISQIGEKRRIPIPINEMPPRLLQAVLATEDSRFYEHPGVDPIGMARAAVNLLVTGDKSQGASTITQQVARNFFLTREKTYIRKIKEIFLAWHIEQILSKDEILELYLNKIELNYRAFGVGAAAQVYYGKTLDELTLPEIAMIAGLPQAPSAQNPLTRPERAKRRRNVVLLRMLDEGYITRAEYEEASEAPLTARYHGPQLELGAPYLAEMVRAQLVEMYGEEQAYTQGLQVYTTVDSRLQRAANLAVQQNLYAYDMRHGYRGAAGVLWEPDEPPLEESTLREQLSRLPRYNDLEQVAVLSVADKDALVMRDTGETLVLDWDSMKWARPFISDKRQGPAPKEAADILAPGQRVWVRPNPDKDEHWLLSQVPDVSGALVSLNPETGAINALVGGFSFRQSKFNRVTQAKRQIGSNIKPFLYSAAVSKGYTLASIINDAPITHRSQGVGNVWRPRNSPPVYDGPTRMRLGLAKSKNVMSVRLIDSLGVDYTRDFMSRFGFDMDDLPRNKTLSLGSASLTPLSVATGFASFANGGFHVEPWFIARVEDSEGEVLYAAEAAIACPSCEPQIVEVTDQSESGEESQPGVLTEMPEIIELDPAQPGQQLAERIISTENAFLVSEMLGSAIRGGGSWNAGTGWNGTGWRANRDLKRNDIYGKTGTTNDAHDAWFSGYTSKVVTTTWVGFDNPARVLGSTRSNPNLGKDQITGTEFGAKTALPAWNRYMKVALDELPVSPIQPPTSIVTVRIDRESGLRSNQTDHTSRMEYFISGTEPSQYQRPRGGSPGSQDDDTPLVTGADEELF